MGIRIPTNLPPHRVGKSSVSHWFRRRCHTCEADWMSIKKPVTFVAGSLHFALSSKDSNLDRQNQNLQCCHYTTRQFHSSWMRVQRYNLFQYHDKKNAIFSTEIGISISAGLQNRPDVGYFDEMMRQSDLMKRQQLLCVMQAPANHFSWKQNMKGKKPYFCRLCFSASDKQIQNRTNIKLWLLRG